MDNKFQFGKLLENVKKMRDELPVILANNAQNFFLSSFDKQGWDGNPWQEVKRRIEGTQEYKYPKKKDLARRTRWILVGKGSTKLRRATSNCIRVKTWPIVKLTIDLPYAKIHNEGGPMARGGFMPKRQYFGDSPILHQQQLEKIKKVMGDLFKNNQ
jgi:phage gpG-like protein